LRAEREAIALVRYLFERPMLKRDVLDRIRAESRISPEVRRVAIQLAESFRDDPRPFHEAAWLVARRPDGTADDYARALEHAQTAALLAPDDVWVLRSLGVAQYRTGKNEEAVETLARCIAAGEKPPSEAQPAELAFLAMAHKKLNHVDEAKRLVDRLRRLLADDRFKGDTEAVAFLREAEGDSTVTSEGKPASQPPVPRPPPRLP
jgi:tetratricopeptide (TPR) repeat protein